MEKIKVTERYMRRLTETEINNYRKEVADLSIDASVLEEEFQDVKDEHKAKLLVRNKQIEDTREVYHVPNYSTGKMEVVDLAGEVIETRRMSPEEMQVSISFNN